MMPTSIGVTGVGMVGPLGSTRETFWQRSLAGECGLIPATGPWYTQFGPIPLGRAELEGPSAEGEAPGPPRTVALAVRAALEAIGQSDALSGVMPHRVGIYVGTCLGAVDARVTASGVDVDTTFGGGAGDLMQTLAEHLAHELGVTGRRVVVNTACAAGAHALAVAMEDVLRGRVDVAIAGGADSLSPLPVFGFAAVKALDEAPCSPYGASRGLNLGEGAAFLVLERTDRAMERGARVLAYLLGYGLSADAHHPTAPDPTGRGAELAVRRALEAARVGPSDIDYINGHGTGTPSNDRMERELVERVFGQAAGNVPISSTKASTGHAFGGSAAMEAALCVLAVERDQLPPTANYRPGSSTLNVVGPAGRPATVRTAMSNSYAFGGNNASLIFGDSPRDRVVSTGQRGEPVVISGIGVMCGLGRGRMACLQALADGRSPLESEAFTCEEGDVRALVSRPPELQDGDGCASRRTWRRMDVLGRLATAATRLALEDARAEALAGDQDVVLLVATEGGPVDTGIEFSDGVRTRGNASPATFANGVMSSTSGHVCSAFEWRGPTCTFVSGWNASIHAILYGTALLQRGIGKTVVVVAGEVICPELVARLAKLGWLCGDGDWPRPYDPEGSGTGLSVGAGAIVLQRLADANAADKPVLARILGGSSVGSASPLTAVSGVDPATWTLCYREAMLDAEVDVDDVDLVVGAGSGVWPADRQEAAALRAAFGGGPVVSAPKSVAGEWRGADGLLGVLTAVGAMGTGQICCAFGDDGHFDPCGTRTRRVQNALVSTGSMDGAAAALVLAGGDS